VVSASAWYGSRLCRKRLLKWKIPQAMEFQVVIEDHRVLGLVARAAGRSSACFRKLSALSWRGSGCSFADTATAEHANQPQPVLIGRIRGKMDGDHSLRCFGGWSEPQLTSPSCQVPACLQQRPEISGDGVRSRLPSKATEAVRPPPVAPPSWLAQSKCDSKDPDLMLLFLETCGCRPAKSRIPPVRVSSCVDA
jgi:hypothetical protein